MGGRRLTARAEHRTSASKRACGGADREITRHDRAPHGANRIAGSIADAPTTPRKARDHQFGSMNASSCGFEFGTWSQGPPSVWTKRPSATMTPPLVGPPNTSIESPPGPLSAVPEKRPVEKSMMPAAFRPREPPTSNRVEMVNVNCTPGAVATALAAASAGLRRTGRRPSAAARWPRPRASRARREPGRPAREQGRPRLAWNARSAICPRMRESGGPSPSPMSRGGRPLGFQGPSSLALQLFPCPADRRPDRPPRSFPTPPRPHPWSSQGAWWTRARPAPCR